jgi:hypothetical protein
LAFPPVKEVAPVVGLDLDIEPLGRGLDAPPCFVAIAIADAFDLVEAGDGVTNVCGIGERFLARLGKGEVARTEVVLLGRAHPLGSAWHPLALRTGALGCSSLCEVSSSSLLLLLRRHRRPPQRSTP